MIIPRATTLALCGVFALGGTARAAPVSFNTALPVSQNHWVVRELLAYGEASRDGNEVHETQSLAALGYGMTPDLAIFGIVPWIDRHLHLGGGGHRGASGLGDVQLFARYTAWSHDLAGSTLRIAPFAGIELPTGAHPGRDEFGRVPPTLQPGSGSWNPLGGIVTSWATLDWTVDAQAALQANTKADGVVAGKVFRADLAVHRRLLPASLTGKEKGFLYGGAELSFRHEGTTRANGIIDPNSGGDAVFATPVLQYAAKRWIAEAGVQIPITQSANGANFKQKFALMAGFHLNL